MTFSRPAPGQSPALYDESKVPRYVLPDPLIALDGSVVKTAGQWKKRRQEILQQFQQHVYGVMPEPRAFAVVKNHGQVEAGYGLSRIPGTELLRKPLRASGPADSADRWVEQQGNGKGREVVALAG